VLPLPENIRLFAATDGSEALDAVAAGRRGDCARAQAFGAVRALDAVATGRRSDCAKAQAFGAVRALQNRTFSWEEAVGF
jgi:hypothetical protein